MGNWSLINVSAAASVEVLFGTKIVPSFVSSPKITGTFMNFPSRKSVSVWSWTRSPSIVGL